MWRERGGFGEGVRNVCMGVRGEPGWEITVVGNWKNTQNYDA